MDSTFETYDNAFPGGGSWRSLQFVKPQQRWVSMVAGAGLAAYGMSKLSCRAIAALSAGAYLVYRGATGHCPIGARLAKSGLFTGGATSGWLSDQHDEQPSNYHRSEHSDLDPFIERDSTDARSLREVDLVDEAAMESFPASDAPSYTGTAATPSKPIF